MQQLPKHLRRRAMSHNRYRVPSRIRTLNEKMVQASKPNLSNVFLSRKHLRTTKLLAKHYIKRALKLDNSNKWLETHVWHAKRMKMMKKDGYKIAWTPYVKMDRTIYSRIKYESVAYDFSYLQVLQIQNISGELYNIFENKISSIFQDENDYFPIDLSKIPATYIKIPPSELWLIVHPSVLSVATTKLSNLNLVWKLWNDLFCIFDIIGSNAFEKLLNIFHPNEQCMNLQTQAVWHLEKLKNPQLTKNKYVTPPHQCTMNATNFPNSITNIKFSEKSSEGNNAKMEEENEFGSFFAKVTESNNEDNLLQRFKIGIEENSRIKESLGRNHSKKKNPCQKQKPIKIRQKKRLIKLQGIM